MPPVDIASEWKPGFKDRFWGKVRKSDGCWEWTGATTTGYGSMGNGQGRTELAHRISWRLHFGPIPAGICVCHHCDNPPCVRPDHLFLGTHSDNQRDAGRKGRTTLQRYPELTRGEAHPRAKLTEAMVREIRRAVSGGESGNALARKLGFDPSTIHHVVRRRRWKHVD